MEVLSGWLEREEEVGEASWAGPAAVLQGLVTTPSWLSLASARPQEERLPRFCSRKTTFPSCTVLLTHKPSGDRYWPLCLAAEGLEQTGAPSWYTCAAPRLHVIASLYFPFVFISTF